MTCLGIDEPNVRPAVPEAQGCPQFMILPTLACQAECSYCFSPRSAATMSADDMARTIEFIASIVEETGHKRAKVTFHGGEPLLAGYDRVNQALDLLARTFGEDCCELGVQSNLWLLDDRFCELLGAHHVHLGTSLDGPEAITNGQRGVGYFARTMSGIRLAQSNGLSVGCIATLTADSAPHWREILDFFVAERLNFSIRARVPALHGGPSRLDIDPEEYGALLCEMFDHYVSTCRDVSISSFDQPCRGLAEGAGRACTFKDCLGMFLTICPEGDIYTCQRFCGVTDLRLGTLADSPSLASLLESPAAQAFAAREQDLRRECADCAHYDYCRGGCPQIAWAVDGAGSGRDPYCMAYATLFEHMAARALEEMAQETGASPGASDVPTECLPSRPKGATVVELMTSDVHPSQVARSARRVIASVELARGPDIDSVATRLVDRGVARSQASAVASLQALESRIQSAGAERHSLHICVALRDRDSEKGDQGMPFGAVSKLLDEAGEAAFRQIVVTGCESMLHPGVSSLVRTLQSARSAIPTARFVLAGSPGVPLSADDLGRAAEAVDEIIVPLRPVSGGVGTASAASAYEKTVRSLLLCGEAVASLEQPARIIVEVIMERSDTPEDPLAILGDERLAGAPCIQFRAALLPGSAACWHRWPTLRKPLADTEPLALIRRGFSPSTTCGLGQNLYVAPSGEAFPCAALCRPQDSLGNAIRNGLHGILDSARFRDLRRIAADPTSPCRECEVRYLCGGPCRGWHRGARGGWECECVKANAERVYAAAVDYLQGSGVLQGTT